MKDFRLLLERRDKFFFEPLEVGNFKLSIQYNDIVKCDYTTDDIMDAESVELAIMSKDNTEVTEISRYDEITSFNRYDELLSFADYSVRLVYPDLIFCYVPIDLIQDLYEHLINYNIKLINYHNDNEGILKRL